jgi:hypothetical protein
MSFDVKEKSRFAGKPIHLFRFERQGLVWRFATGTKNIDRGGFTYLASGMTRGELEQTAERVKNQLRITLPYLKDPARSADFPVTQSLGDNWNPYPPSDTVKVICLATHEGETDPPNIEWMGIVTQPEFTDTVLTLTCEQGNSIANAVNQGPKWQKGCWKTVYSTGPRGCGLDPEAFAVSTTIGSLTGATVTAAAFASAPLALGGGWLEWTRADGLVERRSIRSHSGASIVLWYGAADLVIGLPVVVRPACEQTWNACADRFPDPGNHYGGAIYKNIKPATGSSMSWG